MWEQYQFLRYYLPGFLFFTYLGVILVPALQLNPVPTLSELVSVFGGIIIASPVIGYLIYSPFNLAYEYIFARRNRKAIDFVRDAEFAEEGDRPFYREKITEEFVKQKELLDLVYHASYENDKGNNKGQKAPDANISPEILGTLKNHLNNFAARVVCGLFVSGSSLAVAFILVQFSQIKQSVFGSFVFDNWVLGSSIGLIIFASILLLIDARRVLIETFELENYFIRSRRREIKILMDRIFPREPSDR